MYFIDFEENKAMLEGEAKFFWWSENQVYV